MSAPRLEIFNRALFDGGPVEFNVYQKKLQLSFIYDFGINLAFTDILSGRINLKLKLKFLFFSKTWKKQIARWTGFCPSTGSRDDWCDIPLFKYGNEVALDGLSLPWATIKLNTPFPNFSEITESGPPGEEVLDFSESESYHYDVQCSLPPV